MSTSALTRPAWSRRGATSTADRPLGTAAREAAAPGAAPIADAEAIGSTDRRELLLAIALVADGSATRVRLCNLKQPAEALAVLAPVAADAGVSVALEPGPGGGLELLVAPA